MKIEFHYDFGSPNAYLVHKAIPALVQQTGIAFEYVPILLGGVFKATNNVSPAVSLQGISNKPEYQQIEIKRFCKTHSIKPQVDNPYFPVNTLKMMRGAVFAQSKDYYFRYIDAMFSAMWEQALKMDEDEVITGVLNAAGLPAADIFAGIAEPSVKQRLIEHTETTVQRGNFGSPTFFVGDEIFFGKDRLRDAIEAALGHADVAGDKKMSEEKTAGRVYHEREGHILKITIDNVAKKNAFDPIMMEQLSDAMTLLETTDDLWAGVLCAAGNDFTAGLDMPKFFGPTALKVERAAGNIDPFGLTNQCSKPIVTAVQGIVYTVGIEMMLAGDIAVAADDARFCQMESKRGIAPLGGAHFRYITRSGWGNAMYHLMLCDEFDAAEAYRVGLVQEVVPAGTQVERAMELARMIAANAPLGIQVMKKTGRKFIEAGEQTAIDALPTVYERVMDTEDAKEGIQSFIERREAVFKGR